MNAWRFILGTLALALALTARSQDRHVTGTQPPPIAISWTGPTSVNHGATATFSNTSTLVTWTWDFGDGSTWTTNYPMPEISHTFTGSVSNATSRTVSLRGAWRGGRGSSIGNLVVPIIPIIANFTGTPTSGAPPLTVLFTNLSSGGVTNLVWTFGDGATSNTTAGSVSHTYGATTNDYSTNSVTLLVSGWAGSSTLTRTNYITAVQPQYALIFDGTAYAITASSNAVWTTPPFTVSVCGMMTGVDNNHWLGSGIAGTQGGGNVDGWRLETAGGSPNVYTVVNAAVQAQMGFPRDGTWHKWTSEISADGSTVSNYLDDVFQATATIAPPLAYVADTFFTLGKGGENDTAADWFNGALTDIIISTNGIVKNHWSMVSENGTGTNIVDTAGGETLYIFGGAVWTNIVTHP